MVSEYKEDRMVIVDAHSHILPCIDDGSKSVEMSLEMLNIAASYGTGIQIATPHFYADRQRIDEFLENRQESYSLLLSAIDAEHIDNCPRIILGAEVAYFNGISKAEPIDKLTIEGTNTLLLELPFCEWDGKELDEIDYLVNMRDMNVVVAHLERYISFKKNKGMIEEILDMPVTVQFNSSSFSDWKKSRKLIKMIKNNTFDYVLGSDCHNTSDRRPDLNEGRKIIKDKFGNEELERVDFIAQKILLG